MARNQKPPEETQVEPADTTPKADDTTPRAAPLQAFKPIEVPAVDHTRGFTPIAVTPIDQAITAAHTKEA